MILVLDSSVVAKWYFKEKDFTKARQLLEQHRTHIIQIVIPILLFFELGNIFINKKVTAADEFARNIQDLQDVDLTIAGLNNSLLEPAFAIATEYKLSFYDAAYVALAQKLKCDFVTADYQLYQKTKKLKFVKLL